MTQRTRKLIGTILLLVLIVVYSMAAAVIYAMVFGDAVWWVALLYFAGAGLLWFFPASWLIRWMVRPDAAGPG